MVARFTNKCVPGMLVMGILSGAALLSEACALCVIISSKEYTPDENTQPMGVHALLPAFIILLFYGRNKSCHPDVIYTYFFPALSFPMWSPHLDRLIPELIPVGSFLTTAHFSNRYQS